MNNYFGSKLKELREKHFPGESLRKLSERMGLGDSFYSYISKIELGVSLPSDDFLAKIVKAYQLSPGEYGQLLEAYHHDKVSLSLQNINMTHETAPKAIREFLRTVKKPKSDESNIEEKF